MRTELIRKFTGEIIAKLEYQDNGDIVVRSFYGNILGKYDHSRDKTVDFYGRIVADGCVPGVLIEK